MEECPMEPLPVINSQSLERFSRLLKSTPAYCQYHQVGAKNARRNNDFRSSKDESTPAAVSLFLHILRFVHIFH